MPSLLDEVHRAIEGQGLNFALCVSSARRLRRRVIVYPRAPELRTEDGIELVDFMRFANLLHDDALWPR